MFELRLQRFCEKKHNGGGIVDVLITAFGRETIDFTAPGETAPYGYREDRMRHKRRQPVTRPAEAENGDSFILFLRCCFYKVKQFLKGGGGAKQNEKSPGNGICKLNEEFPPTRSIPLPPPPRYPPTARFVIKTIETTSCFI